MKKYTDKTPVAHEGTVLRAIPIPRLNLATIEDLRREMGRVYRETRSGKLDTQDGTRLVYMLAQIGKMIELGDLEKRLEALENKQEGNHAYI